jgi:hypothetical protein
VRKSPGERSERPSEALDVVQAVTVGMKSVMDSMMEKFSEIQASPKDEDGVTRAQSERFQAISHMDFKTVAPTIRDDEADMDGHDRRFDVMSTSIPTEGKSRGTSIHYTNMPSASRKDLRGGRYTIGRCERGNKEEEGPRSRSRSPCGNKGRITHLYLGDRNPKDDQARC